MKIVVTSHGSLCEGILESYHMLAGQNVDLISIKLGNDDSEYKKEINDIYEKYKEQGILFLCDIVSGTPYNECYKLFLNDNVNIRVVSGLNLAMLLETGLALPLTNDLDALAGDAIYAAKQSITLAKDIEESNEEIDF